MERRTNNGKTIDLEKIMASQKTTVAAGNMNVNANGDVLGKDGQVIQKNEERVRAYYKDHPNTKTTTTSIRGSSAEVVSAAPSVKSALEPNTAKTLRENERVRQMNEPISGKKLAADNGGYKERMDDNGDIEVISYTDEEQEDFDAVPVPEKPKPKTKKKKTDET
jgi:hypothetical protein